MNGSALTVFGILLLVLSLILNVVWIFLQRKRTYRDNTMIRTANVLTLIAIVFLILGFARSLDAKEQVKPIIGTRRSKYYN